MRRLRIALAALACAFAFLLGPSIGARADARPGAGVRLAASVTASARADASARAAEADELAGRFESSLRAARRARRLHAALAARMVPAAWAAAAADLVDAGIAEDDLGRYADALRDESQALAEARRAGSTRVAADALGASGVVALRLGRYGPALAAARASLALERRAGNRAGEGDELGRIGLALEASGRYGESLAALERALAIQRAIGNLRGEAKTLNNRGIVEEHLGRYPAALRDYERALPLFTRIGNRLGAANALGNIGIVEEDLGRYLPALTAHERALATFRALGNPLGEAEDLANTAIVDNDLGRYDESLRTLDRALALDRTLGSAFDEANALGSVGVVYEDLGRFEDALGEFQAALALHRKLGNARGEASDLGNIGTVLGELGRGTDAASAEEAAFEIDRTLRNPAGEAADLTTVGNLEVRAGRFAQALREHTRALALDRATANRLGEAQDLGNVGNDLNRLGRSGEALASARAALRVESGLGAPESVWRAWRVAARASATLGRRDAALAAYDAAIARIEALRASLEAVGERRSFFENKLFVYDEYVDYLRDLDRRFPGAGYDRRALEIFEREQGRAFLEEIGASAARRFSGVPPAVTVRDAELAQSVERLERVLAKARAASVIDGAAIASLARELARVRRERRAFDERLRAAYPAYFALTHPEPRPPEEIQRSLEPGEVALVYGVLDDATALWVIDRSALTLYTLPAGSEELARQVAAVLRGPKGVAAAIAGGDGPGQILRRAAAVQGAVSSDAFALYGLLVPPAARPRVTAAAQLVIVPTGPLYDLPWEALVTQDPATTTEPHYLIDDHAVSYLSSVSLLGVLRSAEAAHPAPKYALLAFANPRFGSDAASAPAGQPSLTRLQSNVLATYIGTGPQKTFDELPGTETEARAVLDTLAPPAESHPLYDGEDASRANILRLRDADCAAAPCLRDYRYVLFATHGVLPDEVEGLLQPALVLAHPERGEGFLTMGDVLGLTLDADVVSLSACNTGRGIVTHGDGVRGLTQAFMYAGTPVVSVTLWESSELAAPRLTPAFYRGLRDGQTPAAALREAKRQLLHGDDPLLQLPYFWAPTIIFGDGSARSASAS